MADAKATVFRAGTDDGRTPNKNCIHSCLRCGTGANLDLYGYAAKTGPLGAEIPETAYLRLVLARISVPRARRAAENRLFNTPIALVSPPY